MFETKIVVIIRDSGRSIKKRLSFWRALKKTDKHLGLFTFIYFWRESQS